MKQGAEAKRQAIRKAAESDLKLFAKLVTPYAVYGDIHFELMDFWMECWDSDSDNTCTLFPRDHRKSHCAAVKAAWTITKNPACTILYVSATSGLAEKQLKAIKDILTSDVYRYYWPEMVNVEEGKREKWTNTEICVDHPLRKAEGVRDSTVFAAGLTTNITGFHASDVFLDDIVVPRNAYTEEGRSAVRAQYSQLASIESAGARETIVGTVYHPDDIYSYIKEMTEPVFSDSMEVVGERNVYKMFVRVVETDGVFLWPKQQRADGRTFGFDAKELARKKAKYLDLAQFFAQYYMETNHQESHRLTKDKFRYYDQRDITVSGGDVYYNGTRLFVYGAIDFAFSKKDKADFTAIAVIGIGPKNDIYVLDLIQFKTDRISVYFENIAHAHSKWGLRKLRAEVTVAQYIIVQDLKQRLADEGLPLVIEEYRPDSTEGNKAERIAAILEHRYDAAKIFHYKGGLTSVLEEQLILARPKKDDLKDALACAVQIAKAPRDFRTRESTGNVVKFNSRFGGVA